MTPSQRHSDEPREATIADEVTPELVLAHLATLSQPASIRHIAHGMGLKHRGRRYLPRVLQKLKKHGEVEETQGGRFRLAGTKHAKKEAAGQAAAAKRVRAANAVAMSGSFEQETAGADATAGAVGAGHAAVGDAVRAASAAKSSVASGRGRDPNLVSGRIVAHRDGYAFLVPDSPMPRVEGDLFIGRDGLGDAMHGDRVLARIERRRADGRAEGRVVQIVQREHPTIVGLFRYGPHGNVVLPYDVRILHEVIIPPGAELTPTLREKIGAAGSGGEAVANSRTRYPELDGAVVNVELTRFPKGGLAPAGRVIEILGRPGEIGVDVEIIIRKHHLPNIFPDEVQQEARATQAQVAESDLAGRRDFRNLPIVTIDGETARDFDDAVHVTPLPNGHYELQVHIADVAHYVARGSGLDREARLRGTSVYFPNRAVPMLPEELSNGICSLNPKVDRLVMSVVMELDEAAKLVRAEFFQGVIRSAERMTYTNVNKVIEGDAEMTQRYAPLVSEFQRMKELALLLNKRRRARGSIDFDLPEAVIEFDADGRMLSIVRSERNIAHRLIEEFMLAANEAVAEYLEKRGVASLHRVHEKPDPKKVLEFEELAHAFGYSLGVEDLAERRVVVRHGRVHVRKRARGAAAARTGTHAADERDDAGGGGSGHTAAALPAVDGKNRGQAGRADSFLLDAAFAEAGALRGGRAGTFCAGDEGIYAFHFADPALSGFDRAPGAEMGTGKSGRGAVARARGERAHRERGDRGGAGAVSPRGIAGHCGGKFGSGAARGCSGARTDGMEDGAIHGKPSGRGIFGADNFGAEVRIFRGAGGNFRGRFGEH